MLKSITIAGALALGMAHAAVDIADYDSRHGANSAPVVGAQFWHSPINTGSSGQNRNVGRWDHQGQITGAVPNISRVTASPPPGASGNAYELRWSFIGTGTGTNRSLDPRDTFLRVFSSGSALTSPVIDTRMKLQFDVWTRHPLRVAIIVSEAPQSNPVGTSGSGSTPLEVIGGIGENALETHGKLGIGGYVLAPERWQTVTIDFSQATVRSFADTGNGILNPQTPFMVGLNSFAFTPLRAEGGFQLQHEVYLDNVRLVP
jgi:hypothetical protein